MASPVVTDSGIFIALVLDEQFSLQADRLVQQWITEKVQVLAPVLFQYEIVAVMRKNVYRGIISAENGEAKCELLLTSTRFIQFEINERLLRRAYELAEEFKRPTAYDLQYLALAEHYDCDFCTADERLYNTVRQSLKWVHWLGSMS